MPSKKLNANPDWLAGSGEMFERILAKDWSKNPLGSREVWPQSLRSALNMMLGSRYPMFVWWGPELINFYNDAYIPVLGARHPEALGRSAPKIWSEIWDVIGPQTRQVLQSGQATWSEQQLLVLERYGYTEETYFTYSYSPIRDDEGSVAGVFCACTEETKRVLGERRLRTLRELASNTSGTRSIQEACDAAIQSLSNSFDLSFATIYLCSEERATLKKIAGTPAFDLPEKMELQKNIPVEEMICPVSRVFHTGRPEILNDFAETYGNHQAKYWPELISKAVILPITQPARKDPVGVIFTGISPRLAMNEQYEGFLNLVAGQIATAIANASALEAEHKRSEALAELDAAKTIFFSNISHEFRTPLTLMLGPLEDIINRKTSDSDELDSVYRNGLRLLKLVNALLDFSRIEAGRMKAKYELTELGTFTTDLASAFRSAVEKAGLRFVIDCPKLSRLIYIDRQMWEQIVLNLISNAFKFTFEGQLDVTLVEKDDSAELVVRDTGVGISPQDIPRVFERFQRIEGVNGRSFEGSGIGLALVNELVKIHDGSISVESSPGVGTAFRVSIPIKEKRDSENIVSNTNTASISMKSQAFVEEALRWLPNDEQMTSEISPEYLKNVSIIHTVQAGDKKPRVLIADDNADLRIYLRHLLGTAYEIETVSNGEAALAAIKNKLPDLLITDVMMSHMDGIQLLRHLRSNPDTQLLPIIMLSARAGDEPRIEGLAAGADDYVFKPFSSRELIARINARLEISKIRQQAEESRIHNMRQLFLITDSAPIYLVHCDIEKKYKFVNKPYAERFGLTPEQIIGKYLWEILGKEAYLSIEKYVDQTLKGKPVQFEQSIPFTELGNRFVYASYAPEFNDNGEVIGLVGAITDITDRRLQEMNQLFMLKVTSNIREATDVNDLFQTVPQMIGEYLNVSRCFFNEIDHDSDTAAIHYDYFSRQLTSLVGTVKLSSYSQISRAEIERGKTIVNCDTRNDPRTAALFETAYGPDRIGAYIAVPLMREERWTSTFWVSVEFARLWKDWEVSVIEAAAEKTWLAAEKLRSEQKLSQLLLQEQNLRVKLEKSIRMKDEFLATLSHELRTPLNSILGWAHILRTKQTNTDERNAAVESIYMSAKNQAQIIDDLLDVSRIIIGKMSIRPEIVKLSETILGAINIVSHAINAKNIELTIDFEDGTEALSLEADPRRLQQILWNLLSNAVKFTPIGGNITVKARRSESEVRITIQDTGSGIHPEFLPFVFERFLQADSSSTRKFGGLGLGLSIVKQLVELHGGKVTAESHGEGSGATFTVFLPLIHQRANSSVIWVDSPRITKNESIGATSLALSGVRVLVIDDDRNTLQLMETIFNKADAEVAAHDTARKALKLLKEWDPDVIICDIAMPDEDGYWFVKQLQSLENFKKEIPVIALTSEASNLDRERVLSSGFQMFVSKPVEPDELLQTVKALISVDKFKSVNPEPTTLKQNPFLAGKKILLIEDDLLSAEMFRITLEREGLECRSASKSSEALNVLKEWIPDIIISDVGLPEEDGYALIKRIRALPEVQEARVPAIALTGYGLDDGDRAIAAGFQLYRSKPLEPDALVALVTDLLKHHQ